VLDAYQGRASVMAWMSYTTAVRQIDTEFDEILKYGAGWPYFSSGATNFEDTGYDLRKINNHHVWAGKE